MLNKEWLPIRLIHHAETGLNFIGVMFLIALMMVGAWDVIARYLFNSPLNGGTEISQILLGGSVFLAWANTHAKGRHVSVDIFFSKYPSRLRAALNLVMTLMAFILFGLIFWMSCETAIMDWRNGKLVQTILIPLAPFKALVSLGALFMCLNCFLKMLESAILTIKGRET